MARELLRACRILARVLALLLMSRPSSAQSTIDLAVEAVRAVRQSDLARTWKEAFSNAPADDVIASLDRVSDTLGDGSLAARLNRALTDESFRLVPQNWRCANVPDHLRGSCAVQEHPYYVDVSGIRWRGVDTATVYVATYARKYAAGPEVDVLMAAATASRVDERWTVVRVERVVR